MSARQVALTGLVTLVSSLALAACGSAGGRQKVFIEWADVSYSTAASRHTYLPDMELFAHMAAEERSPFYADAFTGSPQTTTDYPVSFDFSQTPQAFEGNNSLTGAYVAQKAQGLSPGLAGLLTDPATAPGSPLLTVLAISSDTLASNSGAAGCIGVFTDGAIIEPDFSAYRPLSNDQRAALVRKWEPRLRGLSGAKVYIVGVGYGTVITLGQLEQVRSVLSQLLNTVGARLVVFDERLPAHPHC